VRAEQQALAKWGLNYVIEQYLPRKLADKQCFFRRLVRFVVLSKDSGKSGMRMGAYVRIGFIYSF